MTPSAGDLVRVLSTVAQRRARDVGVRTSATKTKVIDHDVRTLYNQWTQFEEFRAS
jgi:hypothetical protein